MDKLYIIKIGGHIIDDESALSAFLEEFASIGEKKILVHGGGKLATQMAEKLGVPQQVVEGRRITDAATLEIATMVYAGRINKNIVARLQANGCRSLGLTGADGNAIRSRKREHPTIDYGYVGDVDEVNSTFITQLLGLGLCPVFAPLTHDNKGQLLNTNADTIARELAFSLSKTFETTLVFLFEKAGVLTDVNDENTLIPELTRTIYQDLRSQNRIFAGMIPKLDNAFDAVQNGVSRVVIGKASELRGLLEGKKGTTIRNG